MVVIFRVTLAQVVETSVTVTNSSFRNYTHPDDHTRQTSIDTNILTYRARQGLHCPFLTEMSLSAVKTLVLTRLSKFWVVSTIGAWKLFSHSGAKWTVEARWTVTSRCCFSTRTVLSSITDVTLGGIRQVSFARICSRKTWKFCCWASPCWLRNHRNTFIYQHQYIVAWFGVLVYYKL